MKSEGLETVWIQLCTDSSVDIHVRYYRRSCDRRKGKRYKGAYAGLILLGIHDRCSPALASMVSSWSALLSSFEEVRQVLCDRGMTLGIKVIRKLTYRYAERARAEQQAGRIPLNDRDLLEGRRVVISTDGGRTRLREKKRGPKTQKDRTRFRGAWREPKLLIIYVVDAHGKQEKSFSPFIDGCFNGPDGVFHLLKGYLNSLHIQNSDKILFVADGAHWIWNRIPGLLKALGLAPERVYELLDFYHAVEHLGTVAGLRKTWSSKERKRWVSKQRGLLLKGKAIEVVQAVQKLCRGRNSKAIKTERDYFVRNELRLNFSTVKALNLPIDSGAIESSIRRVVNLRLKGPCIFWYRENAEKMIMLRSFYKAGRWNCLKQMANMHNPVPAV
ncbi:MAG: hypothetical protein HUK40_22775 [Desulfobacter sp.]|nr:hypothetical protein [Desulfobacter sp.]MDD9302506.1 hypothetical protein [Desulfobacter sp.]MDD9305010.1 hypothetical protein [Desulfobacter sp.]